MKENELRKHAVCDVCHEKIGHVGIPLFWTATINRYNVDISAVQRQDGLAAYLGGNSMLANVMGADEDMAKPIMEPVTITICENCALNEPINISLFAMKKNNEMR